MHVIGRTKTTYGPELLKSKTERNEMKLKEVGATS